MRLLVLVALAACAHGGCLGEPLWHTWDAREPVAVRTGPHATSLPSATRLKVMTWNIKFAGARIDFWFDLWGDRVHMSHDEVMIHLEQLAALINQIDPDVLLLEEVEVNAQRSAYVDQMRELLARTRLGYAAYVSTWKSRYIPSEGLGRMDMGNAILSKHPIVFAERIGLSDRSDLDPATRAFYLHRAVGRAVIALPDRQVAAFVVHTEAYDTDQTKSKQLQEILALLAVEPLPFVIGGDFNAIPPIAVDVRDFNDEHPQARGTDFEQPPYDLADMVPFFERYVPALPLARYGSGLFEQRRHFTHSVIGRDRIGVRGEPGFWNRTLDYLFASPPSVFHEGETVQEPGRLGVTLDPMDLSDHCPVVGIWELPP